MLRSEVTCAVVLNRAGDLSEPLPVCLTQEPSVYTLDDPISSGRASVCIVFPKDYKLSNMRARHNNSTVHIVFSLAALTSLLIAQCNSQGESAQSGLVNRIEERGTGIRDGIEKQENGMRNGIRDGIRNVREGTEEHGNGISGAVEECSIGIRGGEGSYNGIQVQEGGQCVRYDLNHTECSFLVGPYVFLHRNTTLEDVFNGIALLISDVRMAPPQCRRASLFTICTQAFPTCIENSTECGACDGDATCPFNRSVAFEKTAEYCKISSENAAQRTMSIEERAVGSCMTVEEAVVTAVPVTTCQGEEGVVKCCPEPYSMSKTTGECILGCLQYSYGKKNEEAVQILVFVLFWVDCILVFLGITPVIAMYKDWTFPNYLPLVMIITALITTLTLNFAMFTGAEDWVCEGEEEFIPALLHFTQSSRCIVQGLVSQYMYLSYVTLNAIFAGYLCMTILRYVEMVV